LISPGATGCAIRRRFAALSRRKVSRINLPEARRRDFRAEENTRTFMRKKRSNFQKDFWPCSTANPYNSLTP
jgi:hypothetical protein